METPNDLRTALNEQLNNITNKQIITAAQDISLRYRTRNNPDGKPFIQNRNEALAYAVARMPATFGAVYNALKYTLESMDMQLGKPYSLLDIGAGTGAAAWAAGELIELDSIVCIENNDFMKRLGEQLMLGSSNQIKNAKWKNLNITTDSLNCQADFIIASYVFNELDDDRQLWLAEKLWSAANNVLLLVEAGTPEGYHIINRIRTKLLECDAHILAPCPHENICPLSEQDWCHFTCRIQRSQLHRLAKGGDSPYEDEKYSYLALSKGKTSPYGARILRHPQIGKGHIKLDLCTKDGLKQTTCSKKDGDIYKSARKSDCGDKINFDE